MRLPKRFRPLLAGLLAILLLLGLLSRPSQAHWADLAVGELRLNAQDLSLTLTLPTALVSFADDNQDNQLSAAEIDRHQADLQQQLLGDRLQFLSSQGAPTSRRITAADRPLTVPQDPRTSQSPSLTHSNVAIAATWDQPLDDFSLRYQLFVPGISTARCLITVLHQGQTQTLVFTPTQSEFSVLQRPFVQQVTSFLILGIEHILTGYDHILFLVSLLITSTSLGAVLKIITAFTLSHSLTLTLAVLNIVSLPSQWVECAIALSIIYIAIENIWVTHSHRTDLNHRWSLVFGFGLIHGLGFAGILQDIHIPQSSLLPSLASFNLGVELGQIMIVGLCFGLLHLLRPVLHNQPWHRHLQRFTSGAIIAIGLIWFFERAFPST